MDGHRFTLLCIAFAFIMAACGRNCTEPCEDGGPECSSWNGSFECNGRPTLTGWEFGNPGLASLTENAPPGGGRWCLRLDADWAPTLGFAYAPVSDVADGDVVRLSAFVRAGNKDGGGLIEIYIGTRPYMRGVSRKFASTTATGWTHLSVEDSISLAVEDSVWVVLSSFHTETMPRIGLFDMVVVENIGK